METWEQILLVLGAGVILFLFLPSAKRMLLESRKATSGDWWNLLIPIGVVVLFVFLLIALV